MIGSRPFGLRRSQRTERGVLRRTSPNDVPPPADEPPTITVSRKLIELIQAKYPGTLSQVGDGFRWRIANGSFIHFKVH